MMRYLLVYVISITEYIVTAEKSRNHCMMLSYFVKKKFNQNFYRFVNDDKLGQIGGVCVCSFKN